MKALFYTFLLILVPTWAQACIIGPETATKEMLQTVPEGYFGFQVKLLSVKSSDGSKPNVDHLPHDAAIAEAQVLENYGSEVPEKITLEFGPCSIKPEAGATYYILADHDIENVAYSVNDQPSRVIYLSKNPK